MTQTTANTAPVVSTNSAPTTNVPKPQKPVSKWRYRLIISFLLLVIVAMLGGASYGGWVLWNQSESRKQEVNKLKDEVSVLKDERNTSTGGLQAKVSEQEQQITDISAENKRLNEELTAAKTRIDQLTPKNIKDLNYKQLVKVNEAAGDVWLNPTYVDVNGDGRLDGIFSFRTSGTGGFLNVYVYSYVEGNNLSEILKAEEYQKGTVTFAPETNILEIKSQAGTPDAPTVATTKFKWDAAAKKMVKLP